MSGILLYQGIKDPGLKWTLTVLVWALRVTVEPAWLFPLT